MKRSFLAMIVALALILGAFPAYGGAQEPVIIRVVCGDTYFDAAMDYFNGTHTDIQIEKVEYAGTWPDFMTKMSALMAAGNAPDVAFMTFNYMEYFADNGFILDLTDRIKAELDIDDFVGQTMNAMSIDGKYYGLPFEVRWTQMWYSKDVFDQLGLPYPSGDWDNALDFDQFEALLTQIAGKANADGKTIEGMYQNWREWGYYTYDMFANGLSGPFADDGSSNWSVPSTIEFVTRLEKMYRNGLMATDEVLSTNGYRIFWANDQLGVWQSGSWDFKYAQANGPIGAMPNPLGETNLWIDPWVIFTDSQHPNEAWEVLKWLVSDEYWTWKLNNTISGGLPVTKSMYEYSKTNGLSFSGADEATLACLYQGAEKARALPSCVATPSLNTATGEIFDMMKLGDLTGEQTCAEMDAYWNELIEESK